MAPKGSTPVVMRCLCKDGHPKPGAGFTQFVFLL